MDRDSERGFSWRKLARSFPKLIFNSCVCVYISSSNEFVNTTGHTQQRFARLGAVLGSIHSLIHSFNAPSSEPLLCTSTALGAGIRQQTRWASLCSDGTGHTHGPISRPALFRAHLLSTQPVCREPDCVRPRGRGKVWVLC